MILYNVTVKIETDTHDEWLQWMKNVHIPDVLATGYFTENKLCKLLIDEEDGVTYSIQYFCKDMKTLHEYNVKHAPRLQQEHQEKYDGKFVAFRTLMEVV